MALKKEVLGKMADLITAGFGLVAALAWNSAIQDLFRLLFGEQEGSLYAKLFYAVIVTAIAVIATIWIGNLMKKDKEKK